VSWKKEIIDQPLHALWSGASVFAIMAPLSLGWPLWVAWPVIAGGCASWAGLCHREWGQKRHKPGGIWHNWPWLDTVGYGTGAAVGALLAVFL